MSMVVQHNMQAINANRQLGIASGAVGKSTEKLSSGYRINRAAEARSVVLTRLPPTHRTVSPSSRPLKVLLTRLTPFFRE